MKLNKKVILSSLLMLTLNASASEKFEQVWKSIAEKSLFIRSSEEMVAASINNKMRAENHWMPNIYATGSSYVTNDPGANMFGLLSERAIKSTDFSPESLNHPGSNLFSKATIGVNLSLYEGGMKSAIANASEFQLQAKKAEKNSHERELYGDVAKSYFSILSLGKYNQEINKIQKTLDSIISKYQLGNKSNMLGYSGLLGLRSLKNRTLALIDELQGKQKAHLHTLEELYGDRILFTEKDDDFSLPELNKYLPSSQNEYKETEKMSALYQNAKAANEMIGAEKSRNLPRIGIFSEGHAFNGERETATGYTTGLYLNWNLFSGGDRGASSEAIHNSHAAQYYAQANSQKEKMEFNALTEMELTLVKTLSTLEESQKLLDEQTIVANNLFKNGMINALQLTEVLSRRVDLLKSKNDVEINLIETKAKKVLLTTDSLSFK